MLKYVLLAVCGSLILVGCGDKKRPKKSEHVAATEEKVAHSSDQVASSDEGPKKEVMLLEVEKNDHSSGQEAIR